jgi:hypothetical protein
LPGHGVEVAVPELAVGEIVEVVVTRRTPAPTEAGRSIIEFLESLPEGPRAFPTWDEYERHLRGQRDETAPLYDRLQDLSGQAQELPPNASQRSVITCMGSKNGPGGEMKNENRPIKDGDREM